ncbi:hypothetical protein ACM66B_003501 [Microbotryomycetes sp. NB124-2]
MSDLDLDDELLGLAEGRDTSDRPKSKSRQSSSKRKRAASDESAESDMDMSEASDAAPSHKSRRKRRDDDEDDDSDEEDVRGGSSRRRSRASGQSVDHSDDEDGEGEVEDEADPTKLYPLEGVYKDKADRNYIQNLPELDREAILGERRDKIDEWKSRQELKEMVRKKERREAGDGSSDEEESRRKGGRNRTATGATKSKSDGFGKLREKRQQQAQRKHRKSKQDDEDGDEDEQDRKAGYSSEEAYTDESEDESQKKKKERKAKGKPVELVSQSLLRECMVTRAKLADFFLAPWFEDWVKGAWVRCLLGFDPKAGGKVYRLCQVQSVRDFPDKPYKLERRTTTKQLELSIAGNSRVFKMEFVSDSPFTDREFDRLVAELRQANMELPSAKEANKLKLKLAERTEYIRTEADITAELAKKGPRIGGAAGKARLLVQRDFAISSGNEEMLASINAELAKLEAPQSSNGSATGLETEQDRMRRVNERNRLSNRTEIQRAEAVAQQERRRQEAALARGDTEVQIDPSARVKTLTRLKYDRDSRDSSRQGTPGPANPSSPLKKAADLASADVAAADNARSKGSKFEEMVAAKVDLDVDLDF